MTGQVHYSAAGGIGSVIFDRPNARNAMTWSMYNALAAICDRIIADASLRVVTFRGAGGEAFVAGTDILQFSEFRGGDDGVSYEATLDSRIAQIENLPVATVAIIDGWAMGGGLALAAACDFRIATPASRFGVPIARTLGSCLSIANTARMISAFGPSRAKRILMLADTLDASEALACGFLTEIAEAGAIDSRAATLCETLARNAPITMRVMKESMRRLLSINHPNGEDLVRECYGSQDFRIGVQSFIAKQAPNWTGK
jgi:enoyl-CoA hydratase/carnithine racemase